VLGFIQIKIKVYVASAEQSFLQLSLLVTDMKDTSMTLVI